MVSKPVSFFVTGQFLLWKDVISRKLPMVHFYQIELFIHPKWPGRAKKVQFEKNDSSVSVQFLNNDLQKPLGNERPIDVATLAGSNGAESKREATPAPASATLSRKSLTPSVKVVWGVDIRDCLFNICLWANPFTVFSLWRQRHRFH